MISDISTFSLFLCFNFQFEHYHLKNYGQSITYVTYVKDDAIMVKETTHAFKIICHTNFQNSFKHVHTNTHFVIFSHFYPLILYLPKLYTFLGSRIAYLTSTLKYLHIITNHQNNMRYLHTEQSLQVLLHAFTYSILLWL